MTQPSCTVPGCVKLSRSKVAALCPMHYHRKYRHGDVNKTANAAGITVRTSTRYRTLHQPQHPLAGKSGKVYEHRAVLYAEIGPSAHPCNWCGHPVDWSVTYGPDALQVDHLNGVKHDNRPENLVPSCGGCNIARIQQRRSQALREAGWWSVNDTIAALRKPARRAPIEV